MARSADIGYDINRGSNGIALPRTAQESLATDLPLHNGRHIRDYEEFVAKQLNALDRRSLSLSDEQLLDEVGTIEDRIRSKLLDGSLRLQHGDPRP